MNKLQLGIASLILTGCSVVKPEVTYEEYKGRVIRKNFPNDYATGYNSNYSEKYGVVLDIYVDKYNFYEVRTYNNKLLWEIVDTDSTVSVKCKLIYDAKYKKEVNTVRKFLGIAIDTAQYTPRIKYSNILKYDSKCRCYKPVSK